MIQLTLAAALLAGPDSDVAQALMDAKTELQQFTEEDMKPLAGLMKKARAADNGQQRYGFIPTPTSLLEDKLEDKPHLDPDEVDQDGKTLEDRTLEKEEKDIAKMRTDFNKKWKSFDDDFAKKEKETETLEQHMKKL